ncbi:monocarboxylate transporter 12 [Aplysia californica]|uniref:Monocarboxylate transporter 12 n=1 Tax=Aplysia californica TaxID=6500 RepID=A0ABM0JF48_APLCA|nr:monocarboxylate transporter 12 [Aplysia californica]
MILIPKFCKSCFSVRTSVMLGGIIFSAGVYLTGYASNIYLLFLYYGLLQGVGRGLFSGPALVIVNKYFDKHRSLATGLGTSGVGVGTFAITTLTQYLFDNYDFQSIFLILSGVALHVLLVAMLFRPLSWSKKYQSINNRQHSNKKTDIPTISQTRNSISSSTLYGLQSTESLDKESSTCSSEYGHFERSTNDLLTMEDGKSRKSQEKDKSKKDDSEENYDCCLRDTFQILFPVDNIDGVKKSDKKLFEFHLLRNPSFLLFCISILLFTMAFKAAFTFMAALAESRGISPTNATLILSIAGATDTFGRIGAGIILGFPRLRSLRHIFFNFFVFAIASISFVMPLLQSFVFFCIVCGLYGILTGAYVSQKSVVLADMLGAKQISSSFGMLICFQGFGTLLGVPLSGALKDFFGNYDGVFYLGGASMAVAGILMLASNIVLWRQKRQEKEENASSTKQ